MKHTFLLVFVFFSFYLQAQITLTHNVGSTLIDTGMPACSEDESWSRVFKLSDFGITNNQQFVINSGQVGISKSYNGAYIGFAVSSIDSNFPNSNPVPLGAGGYRLLREIDTPEIVQFEFSSPIVIPAGVDRVLVQVIKSVDFYNPNSSEVLIAGTKEDASASWYIGCRKYYSHISTADLETPIPDANFFINVTGNVVDVRSSGAITRLSHSSCDDLVKTINNSCSYSYVFAGRDYYLADYGISDKEEFIISEGQLAYTYAEWGAAVQFNIYSIDDQFPDSFSELDLIGSSQLQGLSYYNASYAPKIENIKFDTPVVVPAGTKRIFVEVLKGLKGGGSGLLHIAGTKTDDGAPTWYKGCYTSTNYINSDELTRYGLWPGEDYNFYINVNGRVKHLTNNFEMNITNICSEFLKEFSVEDKVNVESVIWDFGDPASGENNTSTDLSPFHDFSVDGTYTITAIVKGKDNRVETLLETIDVKEPPHAYGINNFYSCENVYGSGISSSFNLSMVKNIVLGGQTNKVVTFIDGSGNKYDALSSSFTNTIKDRETIEVRVAHKDNQCCYSSITFDLIVNGLPSLDTIADLYACRNSTEGFASFDLENVQMDIIGSATNLEVKFFHQNGSEIQSNLNSVENRVANKELITVRAVDLDTNCYNEKTFNLVVNTAPEISVLNDLIGCDDDSNGISEYFDTSSVQENILNNQTGMEVLYFDSNGNSLPSPLPNPYTNIIPFQEVINVRIVDQATGCYSETSLVLKTGTQPDVNKPETLYSCNLGDGYGSFDTTSLEDDLIGNQKGLKILYFDDAGVALPSPLPNLFQNTKAWNQELHIRVENELNSSCYTETSVNLVVNELPVINLEEEYFLCDLEPYLELSFPGNFNSWEWTNRAGSILSATSEVNLIDEGEYTLRVTELKNNIICENQFSFQLIRSQLPVITIINYKELSDDNFIEVLVSGDGIFQYSLDGVNFQESNTFTNIQGGVYSVMVRDTKGCGEDEKSVTVVDYPKYFTPNGDAINDLWHIKGIANYPQAKIYIYNRYGKLLKSFGTKDSGWDGSYGGKRMEESDYWFQVVLDNSTEFKGHFSLKR